MANGGWLWGGGRVIECAAWRRKKGEKGEERGKGGLPCVKNGEQGEARERNRQAGAELGGVEVCGWGGVGWGLAGWLAPWLCRVCGESGWYPANNNSCESRNLRRFDVNKCVASINTHLHG